MFCSLSLTSLILVQRISALFHRRRRKHHILKGVLVVGALLLSLTAIFPERYDVNGQTSGGLGALYYLHLLGVFGSGLLLLGVPFVWFATHWYTHSEDLQGIDRVPLKSLLARALFALGATTCCVLMSAYSSEVRDETNDMCRNIDDPESCRGWPMLTPFNCSRALTCVATGGPGCDGLLQPNFRCSWEDTPFNEWTKMLAPEYVKKAACVRHACPLFAYARSVALEFAVLLLTLGYVASFALHDVKRLLSRPGTDLSTVASGPTAGPDPAADAPAAEALAPLPPLSILAADGTRKGLQERVSDAGSIN